MTEYYIAFDNPEPAFDSYVSGRAVSQYAHYIEKVCAKNGLKLLNDFFSLDPALADEFLDEGESEKMAIPGEIFFTVEEGLEWMEALFQCIDRDQHKSKAAILEDLSGFMAVLAQGKENGYRWHFSIDI